MKVAITGGTGFIGQYVINEFLNHDIEPVVLTRQKSEKEASNLISTDYTYEDLLIKLNDVDAVVHLASKRGSQGKIEEFHENEILTQVLFDACRDLGIKNIVNASTISVYGVPSELPWSENATIMPELMYGASKFQNECIANIYSKKYKMAIKNLRIAHVFGFNEKNNYMINKFMRQAFNKKKLVIDSPASAKREFIYAKDVARAVRLALNYEESGTFNIGSGIALTNEEVAEKINNIFMNQDNFLISNINSIERISESYMTSEKATKSFNYISAFDFEEAISEIYMQMKELEYVPEFY